VIPNEPSAMQPSAPGISRHYAMYALLIIFLANFLSYLDRQVVSGLEKELTAAFTLGEEGFGGLWTAFTVGYMVFAPVVGKLVESKNRPRIFGVCVFIWSLATIWSGWATTLTELYAARFLIGIGEAGCLVIGPTLIADYFSPQVRGKALAIFFLGLPLGGTAGYGVAAVVTQYIGTWREAFYFAGIPGIALAVLVWLLIDPPRGGAAVDAHGHGHVKFEGFTPYLNLLKNRTLMLIILAQAFAVIILVPLLHFGVKFLEDKFQMAKMEATLSIGSIALVAGSLGNLLSGVIGDLLAKRIRGAYALLAGVAYLAGAPLLIIGFTTDSKVIMMIALMAGAFCFFLCMPAVNTQIANSVPHQVRAMAYALAVFILHLLGDTFAPILFGRVSTMLDRQNAFVLFSCALFAAGTCALLAAITARRDELQASTTTAVESAPSPEPQPG
jgi:predicted MFS family arabinose efflux permease